MLRHTIPVLVTLLPCVAAADEDSPPVPRTVAEGAKLVEVYAADSFFEGPTWDPKGGKLYFTSFPDGGKPTQILRLDEPGKAAVWLDNAEGANGTRLSKDGRLLAALAYGHRVMSYGFGETGPAEPKVLAQNGGWNQPNDVCQAPNGNIYFTDPDFKNRKTSVVYLLPPDGQPKKILDDMPLPNGLVTSNDGKTLYVGDSHEARWRSYPIQEDGTVGEGSVFFDPEVEDRSSPDGMTIDADGNLYFSGRGGVWVVSPAGEALGLIRVPEFCSNVTFGGADGKTLYLTCSKKVYSLAMTARGAWVKE